MSANFAEVTRRRDADLAPLVRPLPAKWNVDLIFRYAWISLTTVTLVAMVLLGIFVGEGSAVAVLVAGFVAILHAANRADAAHFRRYRFVDLEHARLEAVRQADPPRWLALRDASDLSLDIDVVVSRLEQRELGVDPDAPDPSIPRAGIEVYATAQTARRNQNLRPGQPGTITEINERGYALVRFAPQSGTYRPAYLLPPDGFVTTLEERFRIQHEADLAELQAKEEERKRCVDWQRNHQAQPAAVAAVEGQRVTTYTNGHMTVVRQGVPPLAVQVPLEVEETELRVLGQAEPVRIIRTVRVPQAGWRNPYGAVGERDSAMNG